MFWCSTRFLPWTSTLYNKRLQAFSSDKKPSLGSKAYAEDTQLYLSSNPDSHTCQVDAIYAVQNCIKDTRTWMAVDKLKFHENKTEFIMTGTRAQLNKVKISQLTIGQACFDCYFVRNLRSSFECHFSMATRINKSSQSMLYHFHIISRIRKFLSYDITKSLVRNTSLQLPPTLR